MAKVLVFYDDWVLGMLYQEELIGEGYDITLSSDFPHVQKTIDEQRPDAVLIDCSVEVYLRFGLSRILSEGIAPVPLIVCSYFQPVYPTGPAEHKVEGRSNLEELKETLRSALPAGVLAQIPLPSGKG